jgi:hypothetical protein
MQEKVERKIGFRQKCAFSLSKACATSLKKQTDRSTKLYREQHRKTVKTYLRKMRVHRKVEKFVHETTARQQFVIKVETPHAELYLCKIHLQIYVFCRDLASAHYAKHTLVRLKMSNTYQRKITHQTSRFSVILKS